MLCLNSQANLSICEVAIPPPQNNGRHPTTSLSSSASCGFEMKETRYIPVRAFAFRADNRLFGGFGEPFPATPNASPSLDRFVFHIVHSIGYITIRLDFSQAFYLLLFSLNLSCGHGGCFTISFTIKTSYFTTGGGKFFPLAMRASTSAWSFFSCSNMANLSSGSKSSPRQEFPLAN